tara:strand:- start:2277 stop:3173 length:897 start_codon:yes stop_codon:yes gene_type:complete
MKILITGGTGLIGQQISKQLLEKNHEVVFLSRNPKTGGQIQQYPWDPEKNYLDPLAINGVDTIINLAGASVNKRWTSEYKKEILKSRTDSLQTIYKILESSTHQVKHIISTSAVGYYPDSLDDLFSETDNPGSSFLSKVCRKWEAEAVKFERLNINVSIIRIGLVLSMKGGALEAMIKPFKYGFGSALGNGKQWMPWIHIEDLSKIFLHISEKSLAGIFNGGGLNPVRNTEFSRTLASVMKKPFFMPNLPSIVLKLIMGESAEIALSSTKVDQKKIRESGFEYRFKDLRSALEHLILE